MARSTVTIVVLILGIISSVKSENSGFGYELLASHLESLQISLTKLSDDVKQQAEQFQIHQQRVETALERQEQNMIQLMERVQNNVSVINDQPCQILESNEQPQYEVSTQDAVSAEENEMAFNSMKNNKASGTYADEKAVPVYLEHRFGRDWMVILHRNGGSENFYRDWAGYRDGFGTVGKEYWLGLERMHVLTRDTNYELLVELEDFNGNYRYARYDKFAVGPETDQYPLEKLGVYSGTAGDSLSYHKGTQFTTWDERYLTNCTISYSGGWWDAASGKCYKSYLTGRWRGDAYPAIVWTTIGKPGDPKFKVASMMIRKFDRSNGRGVVVNSRV